jgi:hypothetical protein
LFWNKRDGDNGDKFKKFYVYFILKKQKIHFYFSLLKSLFSVRKYSKLIILLYIDIFSCFIFCKKQIRRSNNNLLPWIYNLYLPSKIIFAYWAYNAQVLLDSMKISSYSDNHMNRKLAVFPRHLHPKKKKIRTHFCLSLYFWPRGGFKDQVEKKSEDPRQ